MTKYSNYKDYKFRQNFKERQKKIFLWKSFLINQQNKKENRFLFMLKYTKAYTDLYGNTFKNRCMNSTKIRSVTRIVNLTKSSFRDNLRDGNICGFTKSSW